jgi:hypothetical protein
VEASLPTQPTNGQPPLGLVEQGSHQTSKETSSAQQKLNTGTDVKNAVECLTASAYTLSQDERITHGRLLTLHKLLFKLILPNGSGG